MNKRKQITFDIDTNVAKKILGKSYNNLYTNIKNFMKSKDWEHIEGSVYMSNKPLSNTKVSYLLDELLKKYPYLTKCIRDMHQSDISNIHGLHDHFDYDGTPGKFAKKKEQENSKDINMCKKSSKRKVKSR